MSPNPLRSLPIPSVNDLLESPQLRVLLDKISHNAVVSTAKTVLDEIRREVRTAAAERSLPNVAELAERIARRIVQGETPPLRPVINATGMLLHGDLGQVPLADEAVAAVVAIARDYSSLEVDLATGERSSRNRAVEGLLTELTGAEAALVVNHHVGATLLTLAALAAGREAIVSRGQLVDVGRGDRLPETIVSAGAVLREVGAANMTRLDDYAQAIGPRTAALMSVHPSSFAVVDPSAGVDIGELVELGRRRQVPVVHDLGCGGLFEMGCPKVDAQPLARQSVQAGVEVVLLSGDGLLGGPQCGIILGRKALLEQLEQHPLARALRPGKLTLAALAATLRLYRDPPQASRAIPLLHLLTTSAENLQNRAERLAPQIAATAMVTSAVAIADTTHLGDGLLPTETLPTWCIAVMPAEAGVERLAAALRSTTPPVIARIQPDRLMVDLRSVMPRHDVQLVAAFESLGRETPGQESRCQETPGQEDRTDAAEDPGPDGSGTDDLHNGEAPAPV